MPQLNTTFSKRHVHGLNVGFDSVIKLKVIC